MGDVVKFARPEVPPEMSLADRIRIRMLAGELNKMADDIDAGSGEGYDECVVVFSDYATGDLLYDSNIDDP